MAVQLVRATSKRDIQVPSWRLLTVLVLLFAAVYGTARAESVAPGVLYECHTIVTGTDARDRPAGLARCFLEVLVKVSGDPALHGDRQASALAAGAAAAVASFSYHDRMTGLPHHDDQGSSDRPQDLAVRYDPVRVKAALARLGERPWPEARPSLRVATILQPGDLHLAPADRDDLVKRAGEALAAAVARYGVPLALPPSETVLLDSSAASSGDAGAVGVPLSGTLRWSEADHGWVGTWTMARQGEERRWGVKGASLDEAFRDAVLGAIALSSGHGDALNAAADAARE